MDYEKAWKILKAALKFILLMNDAGLVEDGDGRDVELANTIIEMMEDCEKSIEGEEAVEDEKD